MSKYHRGFVQLLLLLAVVFIATGALGYYTYKNGQISLYPKLTNYISPTPTLSTSVSNNTGNWKTYRFEKLSISIDYPESWDVNNYGKDNYVQIAFNGPNSDQAGPHDSAGLEINIKKLEKPLFETVKDDYLMWIENYGEKPNLKNIQEFSIQNNLKGYKYFCSFLVDAECIYLQLDSDYYLNILSTYADENNRNYKETLDQILTTIKYTSGSLSQYCSVC